MSAALPHPSLTPEQAEMATAYFGLAQGMARRAARGCPRLAADLSGAADLSLVHAAENYDRHKDRYPDFRIYVCMRVRGALLDVFRASGRKHNRISSGRLGVYRIDPGDGGIDIVDASDEVAFSDVSESFESRIGHLADRQREVIRCIYRDDLTFQATGDRMGLAKSTVKGVHDAAIALLWQTMAWAARSS